MSNKQRNQGVTLITLIITIIVLLILAGVAFNSLLGNNGLLKRTSDVGEVSKTASTMEKIQMEITEKQIEAFPNSSIFTKEDLYEALGVTPNSDGIIIYENIKFIVDDDLNVIPYVKNTDLEIVPIYTVEHLAKVGTGESITIDGVEYEFVEDGDYKLYTNIDLSKTNGDWIPIGGSAGFSGTFNGNNHTIKKLRITNSTQSFQGLFGLINAGAVVKNINLEDVSISTTGSAAAGISGGLIGTIENCNVKGVSGNKITTGVNDASGLVGYVYHGTIRGNCTVEGIETIEANGRTAGGFVSTLDGGTIEGVCLVKNINKIATKATSGENTDGTGGFVGNIRGGGIITGIAKASNVGLISGVYFVGGFVGYNLEGTIDSVNAGDISVNQINEINGVGAVGDFYGHNTGAINVSQ